MKKPLAIALLLISMILGAPVNAQQPAGKSSLTQPFTPTIDASVGGGSIGYNPDLNFGGSLTIPVGRRLELYTQFLASPISKSGYSGYTLVSDGRVLVWVTPRIAPFVGVRPSFVDFGGTHKHAFNGLAGVVIRDHWNSEMPGRLVLAYEQQIGGCVWATPTNPCPLTSAEFIGGRVEQEFQMNSRLRFGLDVAIGRVNQQINPNAPQAGAIYGFATQADLTLRFTLRKATSNAY